MEEILKRDLVKQGKYSVREKYIIGRINWQHASEYQRKCDISHEYWLRCQSFADRIDRLGLTEIILDGDIQLTESDIRAFSYCSVDELPLIIAKITSGEYMSYAKHGNGTSWETPKWITKDDYNRIKDIINSI
jgi:hypothetical protein